jgi:hypothetical protein
MIESKIVIDDYAETAGARREAARAYSGIQPRRSMLQSRP